MALLIALTGGTGFVGGHVLKIARERGHAVRALTRKPRLPADGITWVEGHLADDAALRALVDGADVVVHVAGVTNAPDEAGFIEGNVRGTEHLVRAAGALPFVHVSSLAAREPGLSLYGRTKLEGEEAARRAAGPVAVVRPPAVYGAGDLEFLSLFKAAWTGFVPMPRGSSASMIHGADLAAALVALAEDLAGAQHSAGQVFEIDDGHGGYPQTEVARLIGKAISRETRALSLPPGAIRFAAKIDAFVSGLARRQPKLSPDRAGYMVHPDWSADVRPLLALDIWRPEIGLEQGLRDTAIWYRAQGLLGR